jgi:hypothetical protein
MGIPNVLSEFELINNGYLIDSFVLSGIGEEFC